jgi:nitric oxide dioxygenase
MSEFENTPAPAEKKGITADELAIIKATVPILETGGETLTKHFYGIMLTEYPEVVPFFNKAHQKSGDQPRALANAVLMYAKNIEKLQNLGGLVNQIIHKHVALDINPAHYAVVGACLLRAIREVLGAEVATDAVIGAWATAYGMLADILIGAEKGLMDAKAAAPGGWIHDREFVVKEKIVETPHITSFVLEPADKKPVMAFEAGQYLGLHLTVNGDEVRRNYSISSASNGQTYRITVKREPNGVVSNHLHDHVNVGSSLMVMPPAGEFTLKNASETKPLVFLTAGVGITPAMAMLQETLRNPHTASRDVRFIHCARTQEEQAFRAAVGELAGAQPNKVQHNWYSRDGTTHARLSAAKLADWLPTDRDVDVFLLGSKSFMRDMKKNLIDLGVPAAQIHHEFFGPAANIDN